MPSNEAPSKPILIRLISKVLVVLHKVLPRAAYDRMYLFLFPRYKEFQRRRYRRIGLARRDVDREMVETVFKCMEFSLVGWQGLEATFKTTKDVLVRRIPGDLVECGVAQGGSALLIALVSGKYGDNRHLWLFDSYEGLPDPTKQDFEGGKTGSHVRPLPKGSCLGTIEEVRDLLFRRQGLPEERITLVKGWFQDTLPSTRTKIDSIALLRLDGDWYESTKTCLENLFGRVSDGGFVILDDYFSCFGCKRATDEFLESLGKSYPIIPDGRGGAYFQKTGG